MFLYVGFYIKVARSAAFDRFAAAGQTDHLAVVYTGWDFYFYFLLSFDDTQTVAETAFFFWNFARAPTSLASASDLDGAKNRSFHFSYFSFAVASLAGYGLCPLFGSLPLQTLQTETLFKSTVRSTPNIDSSKESSKSMDM